jgi:hypothetical protein
MKHIKDNFLVVSDYNWLPENLKDSWVDEYSDNYVIYDKYHRFEESNKVKHQKNVGQNIYDMFDFIVENYDNLPETTIFCRACFLWKKDRVPYGEPPNLDKDGNKLSNGNCSVDHFLNLSNNTTFTELHDYGTDVHGVGPNASSKYGDGGSYLEVKNNSYFGPHPGKYYNSIDTFFNDMYKNPTLPHFIRFSPGGNHIIPKSNILRYSKKFYERIREILSWDIVIGEAHMIERSIYTIFTCDWEVKDEYK